MLLIPHLLIQDNQFTLNVSPLGQFIIEFVLNLRNFNFLNGRGIFLQLLRHFLENFYLFLDL